jgi:hypothetical protein
MLFLYLKGMNSKKALKVKRGDVLRIDIKAKEGQAIIIEQVK